MNLPDPVFRAWFWFRHKAPWARLITILTHYWMRDYFFSAFGACQNCGGDLVATGPGSTCCSPYCMWAVIDRWRNR